MSNNKIAVAISIYNKNKLEFLKKALDSIFNQKFRNFDIIIYVDGAIDEPLKEYLTWLKSNKLITILKNEQNRGLGFGLNEIIEYALSKNCYKYLARMDADDISMEKRLQKQYNFLEINNHIDVCGSGVYEFGSSFAKNEVVPPIKHNELVKYAIYRCPFIHPTVMFRMKIFEKSNIRYPTSYIIKEDLALWYKLILHGFKLENMPDKLLYFRLDDNSLERRKGFRHAYGEMLERKKFMKSINKTSLKNYLLIMFKFILHILPTPFMRLIYRFFR